MIRSIDQLGQQTEQKEREGREEKLDSSYEDDIDESTGDDDGDNVAAPNGSSSCSSGDGVGSGGRISRDAGGRAAAAEESYGDEAYDEDGSYPSLHPLILPSSPPNPQPH
jgi:hypothetical protein